MGIISPGTISEGGNFTTFANPKAYTASHTHCTAKSPRFRWGKASPPYLKTKILHDTIPARNHPPPPPLYTMPSFAQESVYPK